MTGTARATLIDEGSGPPLIVFHGWSGSRLNVERWLPALAPRFRVIVPDLPGCNGIPPLAVRHTARAYAEFALRVLDAHGVGAVYGAGLCSGSAIALALAELAPARVSGLLLHTPFLGPALIRPLVRAQLAALASPLGALYAPLRRSSTLATLHRRLFANAGEVASEQLARDHADLVRADVRANRELAHDLLVADRVAFVRGWRRPMGVLVADADAFIDAAAVARVVRDSAPQAVVETIAGGHGWTAAFVSAQHDALVRLADAMLTRPA